MGKTALLEHAVERAQGMLVLRARGVESEAEIPFAGLHALLRPAFDRLDALPQPQAAALRAALGLAPGVGGERFLIGAATLSLLAALAEERPVLVAVDDAQWLDESSLRRDPVRRAPPVRGHGRDRDRHAAPTAATSPRSRSKGSTARRRPRCSPVTPAPRSPPAPPNGSTRRPWATRSRSSSWPPPPPSRRPARCWRWRRASSTRSRPGSPRCPSPTRRLLALAAAEDSGELAVLERAASALGLDFTALAAAERAGLVTVSGDQLAFCHPLARSAAYRSAPLGRTARRARRAGGGRRRPRPPRLASRDRGARARRRRRR